ncbi:hypothetical protein ABW19_dt0201662 [Dactylella cylindrospora]|nr:hypothetical protein ABW19_dt0201662 [Dactylella cylindrospora]
MQYHVSLPTPSASPTFSIPPPPSRLQARQQILEALLTFSSAPNTSPDYPEAPTDRLRGMIYAATYQKIQSYACFPQSALPKAMGIAKSATDMVAYIYPYHNFELQVSISVKLVFMWFLISQSGDTGIGIEELKQLVGGCESLTSSPRTNLSGGGTPETENGIISCIKQELSDIPFAAPDARVFGTCSRSYFGPIATAITRLAVIEALVQILVSRQIQDHEPQSTMAKLLGGKPAIQGELEGCRSLSKILSNWVFPQHEFEEGKYGGTYLQAMADLVGFTDAVSNITTSCESLGSTNLSSASVGKKDSLPKSIECALVHYKAVTESFKLHPQLRKFADAYMKGYICATLASNSGFKDLFPGDWRVDVKQEWKKRRQAKVLRHCVKATKCPDNMEISTGNCDARGVVEEYNSWEFLR